MITPVAGRRRERAFRLTRIALKECANWVHVPVASSAEVTAAPLGGLHRMALQVRRAWSEDRRNPSRCLQEWTHLYGRADPLDEKSDYLTGRDYRNLAIQEIVEQKRRVEELGLKQN
jgi:hypothetical protein